MKQREIKFRAWDGKHRKMFYGIGFLNGVWHLPNGLKLTTMNNIMQYTGIKCNGQEWYDGDILENDSDWYQISSDNDQARWEAVGIRSTGETLALSELLSQETFVQGNIHENHELLK